MHDFSQKQIAVLVAIFLSLGISLPPVIKWDGRNLEDFHAVKALVSDAK